MVMNNNTIFYKWLDFDELNINQLYDIISLREKVFIIEQNCIYLDADGVDKTSFHLLGYDEKRELVAYLRVIKPGFKYDEFPSIGRVVTKKSHRGKNIGKDLLVFAIKKIHKQYPKLPIQISAQKYLEKFYKDFGFKTISKPYDEDGIIHVEMILKK